MDFTNTESIFKAFKEVHVLVIGDVMVDRYLKGDVSRISPEAPVPIVSVKEKSSRLGGAANVALNILALGAIPHLCAVVGNDEAGDDFMHQLDSHQLDTSGIIRDGQRRTTIKNRIMSGGHHLLRIDEESDDQFTDNSELKSRIEDLLPKCQVVVFEDYDKGCLDEGIIQYVIKMAKEHQIPVAVDPKKRNFEHYHGSTLFKPNFKELKEGLNSEITIDDTNGIMRELGNLKDEFQFESVMVTLSSHGIAYSSSSNSGKCNAQVRKVSDVSGAGDTVISIAALGLAIGLSLDVIAEIANLGGGIVCESSGVVPVNYERLVKESADLIK